MERLRKEHIEALREIKRLQVRETGINHFHFQAYLQSVKSVLLFLVSFRPLLPIVLVDCG